MNQSNADIPQVISNSYGDDEQVKLLTSHSQIFLLTQFA
jgi:hypothetical protein